VPFDEAVEIEMESLASEYLNILQTPCIKSKKFKSNIDVLYSSSKISYKLPATYFIGKAPKALKAIFSFLPEQKQVATQ
jgi:hypothetical protein